MGSTFARAPRAAGSFMQSVGIMGSIGEQDVAADDRAEHVAGASSVLGLTFVELGRKHDGDKRSALPFKGGPVMRQRLAAGCFEPTLCAPTKGGIADDYSRASARSRM